MQSACKGKGFTLVELIMVILILAIVSIGTTSFLQFGITIYQDNVNRDRQVGDSRFLIERLTRELREAMPNSVRVSNSCIEFVPIVASSSYISLPVFPDKLDNALLVTPQQTGGNKLIIYPLSPQEVYADNLLSQGKVFPITQFNDLGNNQLEVSFANDKSFSQHSPNSRYFIVDDAVSYCVDGTTIKRYSGYWPTATQQSPPAVNGVLMAKQQTNPAPFQYHQDSLLRHAVIQLNLSFGYEDEVLNLYHEVHIVNVP